jgi:hypothetical protein
MTYFSIKVFPKSSKKSLRSPSGARILLANGPCRYLASEIGVIRVGDPCATIIDDTKQRRGGRKGWSSVRAFYNMTPPPTLGKRKRQIAQPGSQKILGIRPSWSLSGRDSSCLRHSAGEARTPRGGLEGVLLVVVI